MRESWEYSCVDEKLGCSSRQFRRSKEEFQIFLVLYFPYGLLAPESSGGTEGYVARSAGLLRKGNSLIFLFMLSAGNAEADFSCP